MSTAVRFLERALPAGQEDSEAASDDSARHAPSCQWMAAESFGLGQRALAESRSVPDRCDEELDLVLVYRAPTTGPSGEPNWKTFRVCATHIRALET